MDVLIAIVLAGGIVSIGAHLLRRQREADQRAERRREEAARDLDGALPDDVVSYDGVDWIIGGVAELVEGTERWRECRLCDGERESWLIVSPATDYVVLGEPVEAPIIAGAAPPESIDHDGRIYRLRRWRQARAMVQGDLGGLAPGDWLCWGYERPGSDRFWIRRSGEQWRCFSGQQAPRHLLDFIAGR